MLALIRKRVFGREARGQDPSPPVALRALWQGRRFPLILIQGRAKDVPSRYTNTGERVKNTMSGDQGEVSFLILLELQ